MNRDSLLKGEGEGGTTFTIKASWHTGIYSRRQRQRARHRLGARRAGVARCKQPWHFLWGKPPSTAASRCHAHGARSAPRAGFNGGVGLAVCNRRRFSLHRATPAPPRHAPAAVYVTGVAFSPFSSVVAVLVAVGLGHRGPPRPHGLSVELLLPAALPRY